MRLFSHLVAFEQQQNDIWILQFASGFHMVSRRIGAHQLNRENAKLFFKKKQKNLHENKTRPFYCGRYLAQANHCKCTKSLPAINLSSCWHIKCYIENIKHEHTATDCMQNSQFTKAIFWIMEHFFFSFRSHLCCHNIAFQSICTSTPSIEIVGRCGKKNWKAAKIQWMKIGCSWSQTTKKEWNERNVDEVAALSWGCLMPCIESHQGV